MITTIELNQKVNSPLAFIFVLILSTLVAWYTITTAEEVVETAKSGVIFNVQNRIEKKAEAEKNDKKIEEKKEIKK